MGREHYSSTTYLLYQKQAHLPLYATDRTLYLHPQQRQLDVRMLAYNR